MKTEPGRVSTEELLTAVADPQRRDLLNYLHENGIEAITVDELAEKLLAADSVPRSFPSDARKLRLRLQHVHLPKLADTGVLEFDPRTGTARYRSNERVEVLLHFVAEELQTGATED